MKDIIPVIITMLVLLFMADHIGQSVAHACESALK